MSGVSGLNALPQSAAQEAFFACCSATRWANAMETARPFADRDQLFATGDRIWRGLGPDDWCEAFAAHPRIGERHAVKDNQSARSAGWAKQEQSGASTADAATREELAQVNREYEQRFGHVYLVCATGRSAAEMLADARSRMANDPSTELAVAAEEQRKITRLRLERLLEGGG